MEIVPAPRELLGMSRHELNRHIRKIVRNHDSDEVAEGLQDEVRELRRMVEEIMEQIQDLKTN